MLERSGTCFLLRARAVAADRACPPAVRVWCFVRPASSPSHPVRVSCCVLCVVFGYPKNVMMQARERETLYIQKTEVI